MQNATRGNEWNNSWRNEGTQSLFCGVQREVWVWGVFGIIRDLKRAGCGPSAHHDSNQATHDPPTTIPPPNRTQTMNKHAHAPSAYGGSPYNKNAKPGKGPSNRVLRLFILVGIVAYVGLVVYYRSVLHARDEASQHDVATLQSALTNLKDRLAEKTTVAKGN